MLEWLTLLQCPKLGIATLTNLRHHLPSLLDLFTCTSNQLRQFKLSDIQIQYLQKAHSHSSIVQFLKAQDIDFVSIEDERYPKQLKETSRPPIGLFAKGNIRLLQCDQIGVVGSRTPSHYGRQVTRQLSEDLVKNGAVVTSGLALGVDAEAHAAALRNGGSTIAVLGSGLAHVYPSQHRDLALEIAEQGLLITEFLPFQKPRQFQFPQRNRVIAGLSKGVLVTEAAEKSGSLITAKYALEENRDVFAVPGNIYCDFASGTNQLIQNGAKLVRSAADIIEEYAEVIKNPVFTVKNDLADDELLASVDLNTTSVDVISQRSNLPVEQVLCELLELEMQGYVAAVPGGYIRVLNNSNNK